VPRLARYVLVRTLLRAGNVEVVVDVFSENATQVSLAEDDDVIQALSANRTKEAFADWVQIGRARRNPHDLDPRTLGDGGESSCNSVVVVANQIPRGVARRRGLS